MNIGELKKLIKDLPDDVEFAWGGSFDPKCSVKVVKTGEHCPEKPTKKINGDPVCDKCYEIWKHLENNDR